MSVVASSIETADDRLMPLAARLDELPRVRADVAGPLNSIVVVYEDERPFATWALEDKELVGHFQCETAALCADSVEQAFQLTQARLS